MPALNTVTQNTTNFKHTLCVFLNDACRNFRNGPKTDIQKNHDGSTSITYTDGSWVAVYHCSSNQMDSTLKIYNEGILVFLMGCAHDFVDLAYRHVIFDCLHHSLMDPFPLFPVRGSNNLEYTERNQPCYHNRSRGFALQDLTEFSGSESITVPQADGRLTCVYSAQYSGGIVRQPQAV